MKVFRFYILCIDRKMSGIDHLAAGTIEFGLCARNILAIVPAASNQQPTALAAGIIVGTIG